MEPKRKSRCDLVGHVLGTNPRPFERTRISASESLMSVIISRDGVFLLFVLLNLLFLCGLLWRLWWFLDACDWQLSGGIFLVVLGLGVLRFEDDKLCVTLNIKGSVLFA
jgi:hypothetical protein